MRTETRRQRYNKKEATVMPVAVATINFGRDANIAYVIRAAVCFGAKEVLVIGNTKLPRDILNDLSGSAMDYVTLKTFDSPNKFVAYCAKREINLISVELPEDTGNFGGDIYSIYDYRYDFSKSHCVVVGNETEGIPVDILMYSDIMYIPMPGKGYCLNTSQAANIALYEAARQYSQHVH